MSYRKALKETSSRKQFTENGTLSVDGIVSYSYRFFISHFDYFLRLAFMPIVCWVMVQLGNDILYHEYDLKFDPNIPLALISAAFALVWYRQFLLGSEHATYEQLYDHIFSKNNFDMLRFFRSIVRIAFTAIVLFVPTLMLSVGYMIYQYSQGKFLDSAAIESVAFKSTTIVLLMFSPILVRLSQYTVGVALGRRSMSLRNVWKKTTGNTWVLWLLIVRALLPISLYTYFITWFLGNMSERWELNYVWASLFINIPTAFLTFMMLAIIVGANGEVFKTIFGIRLKNRGEES